MRLVGGDPMSVREPMLTDEQWAKIEPLLPQPAPRPKGGRPPADNRRVFEGILWVLKTGARWKDLPDEYPYPTTCWRRLRAWHEHGVFLNMWRAFLSELDHEGVLEWEEVFVDATFIPAKKGARRSGKPRGEREQSSWYWSMAEVCLWEAIPTLPRPLRSRFWTKCSKRSESPNKDPDDRGRDPKE
jgi:transposase